MRDSRLLRVARPGKATCPAYETLNPRRHYMDPITLFMLFSFSLMAMTEMKVSL